MLTAAVVQFLKGFLRFRIRCFSFIRDRCTFQIINNVGQEIGRASCRERV